MSDEEEEEENDHYFLKLNAEFYSEIIGYKSVVDLRKEYKLLSENLKDDLKQEVEFYYDYFSSTSNSSIIIDVNNRKISNLTFDIDMYIYSISPNYSRIGFQVFLKDNSSPLQNCSYMVPFYLKNEKHMQFIKSYLYNILFIIHVFCFKFKYHPMLMYLYHEDDIESMATIKLRRNRLFGDTSTECCVCMEQTVMITSCNHNLCHICYSKLKIKICPLCRSVFETSYVYVDAIQPTLPIE